MEKKWHWHSHRDCLEPLSLWCVPFKGIYNYLHLIASKAICLIQVKCFKKKRKLAESEVVGNRVNCDRSKT